MKNNNWEKYKISNISVLLKDGTHGTHKNVENGPYLLSAQNIEDGNIIINENDRRISNKDFDIIHHGYKLQNDDILITIVGSLGRCAILKNYNNDLTFQRSVAIIRFNKTKIIPKFAYYQIQTNAFQKELARRESKGAQGGVYLGELAKIQMLVPDLETQQKIVQILDTWNDVIELLNKRILSEKEKFTIFQHNLFMNSDYDKVPLGHLSTMHSGGTPNSKVADFYGGDILWVSIADMTTVDDLYLNETKKHLTKKGFDSSSAIKIHPKGSVLYAMYASIGECVIAGRDMTSSQAILGINCKTDKLYNKYLYYYLTSNKQKIKTLGQQGTQSNLNAKMVKEFEIPLPPLEMQVAISKKLDAQVKLIQYLEDNKKHYLTQYKYLLNHLISGDFDLTNIKLEKGKEQQ